MKFKALRRTLRFLRAPKGAAKRAKSNEEHRRRGQTPAKWPQNKPAAGEAIWRASGTGLNLGPMSIEQVERLVAALREACEVAGKGGQ